MSNKIFPKKRPLISVIIPTRNSASFLKMCLPSIFRQNYSNFEVIISDNGSSDETKQVAHKFDCIYVNTLKPAPQVCTQRNSGAKKAKGKFLLFLDHDMELPGHFMSEVAREIKKKPDIDAWTIPEHIFAHGKLMTVIRNFENECSRDTVISAARLIKKEQFFKTTDLFDPKLSGGPADWDMDIQLKELGCRFKTLNVHLNHHEEGLTLFRYVTKKAQYISGIGIYKQKWLNRDRKMYDNIVRKQFDPFYRSALIFIENGKWIKTIMKFHIYILLVLITFAKGVIYYINKSK